MLTYWGLLLFYILEYVRPTSYIPALLPLKLNSIVPLLIFAGALVTKWSRRHYILADRNTSIIAAMLFLLWISMLTADVTLYAYTALTTVGGYALIYWVMTSTLTDFRRIQGAFKGLVFVHLLVAYLNPVLFTDPANRHYLQSGFFLGDGNDFALSLNVAIPLCLGLLLGARKWRQKIVWGLSLLVLVSCVVLTQSRGGTMALAAMGLYYWIRSDKKFQTALLVFIVVLLIFAYAPASYFERMNMMTDTQEGSASARINAWKTSIRMAVDNPILGVGAGHFAVKIGKEYRSDAVFGSGMTAHSLYFLALGELGLPGFALVISFLIWNFTQNRRLAIAIKESGGDREDDLRMLSTTSSALIAFAVGAAFLSCLYYPHIYILCGLMTATREAVRVRSQGMVDATPAPQAAGVSIHWALRRPPSPALAARRGQ